MTARKCALFGFAAIAAINLAAAVWLAAPSVTAHHARTAFSVPASAEPFVGL